MFIYKRLSVVKLSANSDLKSIFPKSVPFNLYVPPLQSPAEWAGLLTDQIVTINDSNPGLYQKTLKNEYGAYFTKYYFSLCIVVYCSGHDWHTVPSAKQGKLETVQSLHKYSAFSNLPSTSSPSAYMDCGADPCAHITILIWDY